MWPCQRAAMALKATLVVLVCSTNNYSSTAMPPIGMRPVYHGFRRLLRPADLPERPPIVEHRPVDGLLKQDRVFPRPTGAQPKFNRTSDIKPRNEGPTYTVSTECADYESGETWSIDGGVPVVPFLGVRYARPMNSSYRWTAPVESTCSPGQHQRVADWGDQCVQVDGSGSEDCLKLNVFVPEFHVQRLNQSTEVELLPVFVYLHGGGLVAGSSNGLAVWDAGAAPDWGGGYAVTVSGNYRLNLFGFLATAELSMEQGGTSGNYGIQDQQLMLSWVQKHISAFGGDPARVTVIGQSSGGTSIFALLSSPLSRGLFQRAISLSGSPNITMDLRTAEAQNAPVVEQLGCANNETSWEERLKCLRDVPANVVPSAMPHSWTTPGLNGLPISPQGQGYGGIPIVDGRVITMDFRAALAAGLVDVPLILSNMQHEVNGWSGEYVSEFTDYKWSTYLQDYFRSWPDGEVLANRLYALYQVDSDEDPQKAYDAIVSDYALTCGNVANARAAALGNYSSPIYVVVNEWSPSRPMSGKTKRETLHEAASATPGFWFSLLGMAMACAALLNLLWPPRAPNGWWRAGKGSEVDRMLGVGLPTLTVGVVVFTALVTLRTPEVQQYAFHTWDLLCWIRSYPAPLAASDVEHGRLLRSAFHELALHGRLNESSGWLPYAESPSWPDTGTVYVIRDPSRSPFLPSGNQESYKSEVCRFWESNGVGQASWWCD